MSPGNVLNVMFVRSASSELDSCCFKTLSLLAHTPAETAQSKASVYVFVFALFSVYSLTSASISVSCSCVCSTFKRSMTFFSSSLRTNEIFCFDALIFCSKVLAYCISPWFLYDAITNPSTLECKNGSTSFFFFVIISDRT